MTTSSSPAIVGAVVIDASVVVAIAALAEKLSKSRPTVLLTFDEAMPNQAKQNAPTVTVQLLTI